MTDGDRALIWVSGALASGDRVALADAFSHASGAAEDSDRVTAASKQLYSHLRGALKVGAAAFWERVKKGYAG